MATPELPEHLVNVGDRELVPRSCPYGAQSPLYVAGPFLAPR